MKIEVWSDVVCPWCYLGKRRLEGALDGLDWADEVELRWRAYQLDPTAGREPKDLRSAIERKYGPGAFDAMAQRLCALGAEVGIDYRFDRAKRVSSLDALRLVAWAQSRADADQIDQLHERLFRAYFTEGANIADHANLVAWALEVGLDGEAAAAALAGEAGRAEVMADLEGARERSITGVPAFVINDAFTLPGAQDTDTIRMILTRARERLG